MSAGGMHDLVKVPEKIISNGTITGVETGMESEIEMPEKSPVNGEAEPVRRASQGHQKLTYKQEKFCKGVAKGLTYSDAYRQAYSCENMKPSTIHRNACLIKVPDN